MSGRTQDDKRRTTRAYELRQARHAVPLHALTQDPTPPEVIKNAKESHATGLKLMAARQYQQAVSAFRNAWSGYQQAKGDEARIGERDALRQLARVHMDLAEFSHTVEERNAHNRFAAEFFLRTAWAQEKLGQTSDALDMYRHAAHYFQLGDDCIAAAMIGSDGGELAKSSGNRLEAAQLFGLAAGYQDMAECEKSTEARRWIDRAAALRNAARAFAALDEPGHKGKALELYLKLIEEQSAEKAPDWAEIVHDCREALETANKLKRIDEINRLAFELHAAQRLALHQTHYIRSWPLLMSEYFWGYGVRPFRLLLSAALGITGFAGLYYLVGGIHRLNGTPSTEWARVADSFMFSVYRFLPTAAVEWLVGVGWVKPDLASTSLASVIGAIETLYGLLCLLLAGLMSKRFVGRYWFSHEPS